MNTTASIFDHVPPDYTVVGGAGRAQATGLHALLLHRGSRYPRRTLFQELEKLGFDSIVSVEGPQERYDVEELSLAFPSVRFIILKERLTPGEQINLAVPEIPGPLFFVLWNDLRVLHSGGAARMAERIFRSPEELRQGLPGSNRRLCTVPLIQNSRFEALPALTSPVFYRGAVKTLPFAVQKEGAPTLCPFDGVGIYDRERFVALGGFDGALKNPHWQLMDFGFRAWLWGEEIRATQLVRLSYNGEAPLEDSTAEESYRRFYLKNLAPLFRDGEARLPLRAFWRYLFRSGGDPFSAWAEFAGGRRWVRANSRRFRRDARTLTEFWESPAPGQAPGETVPPSLAAAGDFGGGRDAAPESAGGANGSVYAGALAAGAVEK